jgi:lysozyme
MKTSNNGLNLIKNYEGLVLYSYDDAKPSNSNRVNVGQKAIGTLTIGWGHTNAAGLPKVYPGQTITKAAADTILANDLIPVENQVNSLVKVPLTQNQFDALVSFQYNTGSLGRSSALKLLNEGKYKEAADALLLYNKGRVHGKLVVMDGLVKRRNQEKKLFLTPDSKSSNAGPIATGTVAGGAVVAATSPEHLWPWIIVGTAIAAIAIYIGVSIYEFNKLGSEAKLRLRGASEASDGKELTVSVNEIKTKTE